MNILFAGIILLTVNFNEAILRDLSGSYNIENCSCTVLRCLAPYLYQFNQTKNGDLLIHIFSNTLAARGKTISINNGQQTQISIQWLPGMDFDTNCTGLWMPATRSIELRCGDQYRYCSGQFQCRQNSGPCANNSSTTLYVQYINALGKLIISSFFLLLFKKISY
jgi:hypothetical protein